MSDDIDPGGGENHPPGHPLYVAADAKQELSTMTPAVGRDGAGNLPCKLRNFAEILNEEQKYPGS